MKKLLALLIALASLSCFTAEQAEHGVKAAGF
jgi:hypothetical protein